MPRRFSLIFMLWLACASGLACNNQEESPPASTESSSSDPFESSRTTLEGRWYAGFSTKGECIPLLLLDIAPSQEQPFEVKLLEFNSERFPPNTTLKSSTTTKDSLQLVFEKDGGPLEFEGKLVDGVVWGTLMTAGGGVDPARLVATDAESFDDLSHEEEYGRLEMIDALGAEDPTQRAELLQVFIDEHPRSPLSLNACESLIGHADDFKLESQRVVEIAETYLKLARHWGPRMVQETRLRIALAMSHDGYMPAEALKYAEAAEANLPEKVPESWRRGIDLAKGRAWFRGTDPELQQKGYGILREFQSQGRLMRETIYEIAAFARNSGDIDAAMGFYAELATLPPIDGKHRRQAPRGANSKPIREPKDIVAELYKEKHGSTEGLNDYLAEAFRKSLDRIPTLPKSPLPERGNQIVLFELFTGQACGPCVAVDLALAKIETEFKPSEVVVLRYHEHSPAPDPLANEETGGRFRYYFGQGTPTIVVNGFEMNTMGGSRGKARSAYVNLRRAVYTLLQRRTTVRLALDVSKENDIVSVSVNATGTGADVRQMSLRLVLAEKRVIFAAANGVLVHQMVVRTMLGGSAGIPERGGRLNYEGTVNLKTLRRKLLSELIKLENELNIRFSEKPLDLNDLYLVAFVQRDVDKMILQSAVVPLTPVSSKSGSSAKTKQQTDKEATRAIKPKKSAPPEKKDK